MFSVGFLEIFVIALVALIAFGPEELPKIMKKLARIYRSFDDMRKNMLTDIQLSERPLPKSKTDEENISHG